MSKKVDSQFEPVMIKLFCPRCGKEVRTLRSMKQKWDEMRYYTLGALKILLVCSDCLLKEIRADRQKGPDLLMSS